RFRNAGVPIVGDDIKSQLGATIVHRALAHIFAGRGIDVKHTYQLNTGGNTDFLNMLARDRLSSKKLSKTRAVQSQFDQPLDDWRVHIGPSDYVPWQKDNKICFLRMEGEGFGGQPIELEMRLSVQDSPNSAGIVVDAIRCAALARRRGLAGPIKGVSAWLMKSPPEQMADEEAKKAMKDFIVANEPVELKPA
ncbi:MAG: inositol-3-phosphate synthase, partial [Oceanobacter sp.]